MFSKNIFVLVLQHDRKAHIELQVTRLKVKIIKTRTQTIISSAKAMNVVNVENIPTVYGKR